MIRPTWPSPVQRRSNSAAAGIAAPVRDQVLRPLGGTEQMPAGRGQTYDCGYTAAAVTRPHRQRVGTNVVDHDTVARSDRRELDAPSDHVACEAQGTRDGPRSAFPITYRSVVIEHSETVAPDVGHVRGAHQEVGPQVNDSHVVVRNTLHVFDA